MSNIPYKPLDRRNQDIRLIVLQDAHASSTDPAAYLSCQLIVTSLALYPVEQRSFTVHKVDSARNLLARTSLDSQPFSHDFYALSYVWGDTAAICDIEINGQPAKIGANLHAALQAIQHNTPHRVLWADALCINQADNNEKSWQVRQMGALYARARATISWLGPFSADSDLALQTLADLDKKTWNYFWPIEQAKQGHPPVPILRKNLSQISQDDAAWAALASLCARSYWSRIWIFVELACARDRLFLCGNAVVKDIIRPLALLLAWTVWNESLSNKSPFHMKCDRMIVAVQVFRFFDDFPHDAPIYFRPGKLHDMLLKLKNLDAGDTRDLIYAPLGIATDRQELALVPDYSDDLDLVFTKTACALLRQGCVEVIVSAGLLTRSLQLPSWVPDWSVREKAELVELVEFNAIYCADKGHHQRPSTLNRVPRLADHVNLDGYLVGTVDSMNGPCPIMALESEDPLASGEPTFSNWLKQTEAILFPSSTFPDDAGRKSKEKRKSKGSQQSILARLLLCPPGPTPQWSLFPQPYTRFYRTLESAASLTSVLLSLEDTGSPRKAKADNDLTAYIHDVHAVLSRGSRPFRMDSGHIGLSWDSRIQLNDVLVVIPGASMPCILRRVPFAWTTSQSEELYELVGVAFVDGIMNGEFFKDKRARDVQLFSLF